MFNSNSNYIISIYVLVDDFLTPLVQQSRTGLPKIKEVFLLLISQRNCHSLSYFSKVLALGILKPFTSLQKSILNLIFLIKKLLKKGVKLITNVKLNMENKLIPLFDKLMLKKCSVVEVSDWSVKRRVSS